MALALLVLSLRGLERRRAVAEAVEQEAVVPPRSVAVPGGGSWVAYGQSAAVCGDRRGEWAARGVQRVEWQAAPAAPAVNVEQTTNGYTVWCMMPENVVREATLNLSGDLLLVGFSAEQNGSANCLRLRLPGGGAKRIADTVYSNGWLRIAVANVEPEE